MTKPAFLIRSKQMQLPDVVGLLYLTEKFRFMDLLDGGEEYEIDSFSPVYKSLYDEYLGTDSKEYPIDNDKIKLFYHTDLSTNDKIPVFRTYFDWTSDFARGTKSTRSGDEDKFFDFGNNWPIQVEIRVELSEPRADTIQAIGGRKFLRGGTLQFLITAPTNVFKNIILGGREAQLLLGKPMGSIFRIAQYYIDKYGSTDAMQLLSDIPDIKEGLEKAGSGINQFEDTDVIKRKQIMKILFPETDFDKDSVHYIRKEDPNDIPNLIWVIYTNADAHLLTTNVESGCDKPDPAPDPTKDKEGNSYLYIPICEAFITTVKSFRTLTAVVTNIRFVPKDRIPVKLFNATYGLAVTIPFTYEQQK